MDGESEELKLLKENNRILKQCLEILKKMTSEETKGYNFFLNVMANLFAKKLEKIFRL